MPDNGVYCFTRTNAVAPTVRVEVATRLELPVLFVDEGDFVGALVGCWEAAHCTVVHGTSIATRAARATVRVRVGELKFQSMPRILYHSKFYQELCPSYCTPNPLEYFARVLCVALGSLESSAAGDQGP